MDNWLVIALLGLVVIGLVGYIGWLEQEETMHEVLCSNYGWMSEYKEICKGKM